MSDRQATVERSTAETQIALTIALDGRGAYEINTGVGFFDHMLCHIARHGLFDLTVQATGDTEVDAHHLVEDVGIVLGKAIADAVGDKRGLVRYGLGACPMDEALVMVAIDLGGRSYLRYDVNFTAEKIGEFDTQLIHEFFAAVAANAGMALHVVQQSGDNAHHVAEGAFKSFARALDQATRLDDRITDVPSTKGVL